jgi:hypothetical protein
MYNLNKLSHASLVESADKIMLPLLKYQRIVSIETNSINAVIYTIAITDRYINNLKVLNDTIKPIGGCKMNIEICGNDSVKISFYGANGGSDIWLVIQQNKDKYLSLSI